MAYTKVEVHNNLEVSSDGKEKELKSTPCKSEGPLHR